MRTLSALLCLSVYACLSIYPSTSAAQIGPPPLPPYMCSGGLQPDGYIDWSMMPAAPIAATGVPTPPVTATLPVQGIPGLTVTVTIPPLTKQAAQGVANIPAYTTVGNLLELNALDPNGDTFVTLQFNNPIRGLGAVAESPWGKNTFSASLQATGLAPSGGLSNSTPGEVTYSSVPILPYSTPVESAQQIRASFASIQQAELIFDGAVGQNGFWQAGWSNVRIESGKAADPSLTVPTDGLVLWLAGDKGSNSPETWYDQSPAGGNATVTESGTYPPPTAPQSGVYDGTTCAPAYSFIGNEYLNFNRSIDGWRQMTILIVAKPLETPPALNDSQNSAIFWQENQYWGNTYLSPYADYVTWRFGTTKTNTDHVYVRPITSGGDYTITMSQHDDGTESLWVNGTKVQESQGNFPVLAGTTGQAVLGEGLNGTPYNGRIAEVLVWNRILSSSERDAVNHYLKRKYGIQ